MELDVTITIAVFIVGLYLLGIGYRFLPDPGKKGSYKNEEHFNKYRKTFKAGGVLSMVYVLLQALYIALGYAA